ncbi:MAG: DNA translocase FtsK, partial [Clostridia bacterium]|nr:DNA translocase FtsK [Clostridia bacterium]
MAETNSRKKSAAAGKSTGVKSTGAKSTGVKSTGAKSTGTKPSASRTKTATSAAKKPANTKKKDKNTKAADDAQMEAKVRRKNTFTQQFLPYILVAISLFLGACFIMNAIGDAETPDEHMMGAVGYYICEALFGCFGGAAYMIPLLMINLVIFWKRCYEDGLLFIKVLLSVVMMLLISAVIHVAACHNSALAGVVSPGHLYRSGADFNGGGIIGGLLGYLLYKGLKLPGTIVLAVLTLPLLLMCLVGVTPAYVFGKLGHLIKSQWQKSAEERALREEEAAAEAEADEDDEAEEKRKAATAEKYRERRAKADAKAEKERAKKRAQIEEPEVQEPDQAVTETDIDPDTDGEDEGDNLVVNPRTGEVLGTESGKRGKHRRSKNKSTEEIDNEADEVDEPVGLPFYEKKTSDRDDDGAVTEITAAERKASVSDEPPFDIDDAEDRRSPTTRLSKHQIHAAEMDALPDDDDVNGEADTMEVGYDDDGDEAEFMTKPAVNYEVVTSEEDPNGASRKKNDPYATVRILKSETAAVAEAGLSEEEVVISSAHTEEELSDEPAKQEYVFPPVDLLTKGSTRYEANDAEIAENTQVLREVLESFHIRVKEISCSCGPTITRFEVKPDSGVRVRSIANLVDDIAMGLAKAGVRIEAPIPGKAAVGIEVPNAEPSTVYFRNILETPEFRNHKSRIASCLGADVSGRPVILDINKMPHLLVAGTTGSGKSVCINSIIMSILYKAKPDEVKLILIDPKKVEFAVYRDLPHLYCPLISDPKKAAGALNSAVNEMERRFELIEEVGVRNLAGYNEVTAGDPERPPMPQMIIIIDELADLMMTASNEVETAICRLAQKTRAAGIHLILGTQRPSTD